MRQVFYTMPTYKCFDLAYEGIEAAMHGSMPPNKIIVVDNSGDGSGTAYLTPLVEKYSNVFIWPQTYNLGCARAWNLIHQTIDDDYIIIANDDVKVHHDTIERVVLAADLYTDEVIFSPSAGNAYSFFLLKNKGYKHIGPFDDNFYPAYFEDVDHYRRATLLGYKLMIVNDAPIDHERSSTIKRYTRQEMEMHHNSFRANEAYYIRKHGGLPHQETYETLFNQ